jgi:hypothetical protein
MQTYDNLFWMLLWFFFMASAIQPYLQQRVVEAARRRKIARFARLTRDRNGSSTRDHAVAGNPNRPLYRYQ